MIFRLLFAHRSLIVRSSCIVPIACDFLYEKAGKARRIEKAGSASRTGKYVRRVGLLGVLGGMRRLGRLGRLGGKCSVCD